MLLASSPCYLAPPRLMLQDGPASSATQSWQLAESLRSELETAVQNERFDRAAELRDEIAVLFADAEVAVLDANAKFYAALRSHDVTAMEAMWPDSELSPASIRHYDGFSVRRGRTSILECWREVRSDAQLSLFDLRCSVLRGGCAAVVTCIERRLGGGSGDSALFATNVFELVVSSDDDASSSSAWRLKLHQATPIESAHSTIPEEVVDYDADDMPGATG